jgi:EAL domain-containing protein (putative c-di-GMP-specific phosphodiesterase class I)
MLNSGRMRKRTDRSESRAAAEASAAVEAALRDALANDELFLEYQPIVSLSQGSYAGAEALLRWRRPGQAVVRPDDFIPLAEETGLILLIGHWVIQTACAQLREWRDAPGGNADWYISVNVAASQLTCIDFPGVVERALAQAGLEASALRLELTESTHLDARAAGDVLGELSTLGIRLSLDHFGTKHSSLSYLLSLPIGGLKIDRSVVEGVVDNKSNQTIVEAICIIGESLSLGVTAEGVETVEQLTELRRLGCGSVQGDYFAGPMLPDACLDVLLNVAPALV